MGVTTIKMTVSGDTFEAVGDFTADEAKALVGAFARGRGPNPEQEAVDTLTAAVARGKVKLKDVVTEHQGDV